MRIFNPIRSIWRKTLIHLGKVWTLSLPYFRSDERWSARFLLLACVALNSGVGVCAGSVERMEPGVL
jgi:vitamin B12/bleomycin/antimicrobial peptide transport system ATP-binding/permease protein